MRALEDGADRPTANSFYWRIAGRCERPVVRTIMGRFPKPGCLPPAGRVVNGQEYPLVSLDMEVECRRCPACLRKKAWQWRVRMMRELAVAPRTWFVTLTISPDEHARLGAIASKTVPGFFDLDPEGQFPHRHALISKEITKFFKRLRKKGGKFRYCIVAEAHKDKLAGLPHYHALIHESVLSSVPKRLLQDEWKLGFSSAKLVDDNIVPTARYVAKYISKAMLARVRASVRYGEENKTLRPKPPMC